MLYTKLDIQDLKKVDYKVDMNIVKFNAILTIFGYVVLTLTLFAHGVEPCTDSDGDRIMDGKDFTPDYNDACKVCTCDGGLPILCRTAVCSPPSGCQQIEPVPRQCCQFVCKDDGKTFLVPPANSNLTNQLPAGRSIVTSANQSFRLVASTVTSILVLGLLLLMVHRVRQHRLLVTMRRFETQTRLYDRETGVLDRCFPAAFWRIEYPPSVCPPPPPYSSTKPEHLLREEPPPRYESVAGDRFNNDSSASGRQERETCDNGAVPLPDAVCRSPSTEKEPGRLPINPARSSSEDVAASKASGDMLARPFQQSSLSAHDKVNRVLSGEPVCAHLPGGYMEQVSGIEMSGSCSGAQRIPLTDSIFDIPDTSPSNMETGE